MHQSFDHLGMAGTVDQLSVKASEVPQTLGQKY